MSFLVSHFLSPLHLIDFGHPS
uniref:Uncharacterized protein n=1 Tax=Rhizophora mucronata TaxID=61149 RepID=A0A2P2PSE5_RHIMU